MGEALAKWALIQRRRDLAKQDGLPPEESKALAKMQDEAKQRGVTLASGGKGGLPPSLVLGIFRRDGWKCKVCGTNAGLSIHHKGGIEASKWLKKKDHSNDPNNLVTICGPCHDNIHEKAREEGIPNS
jgi:cytochrome c553